jgi:hypothetical protein
MPQAIIVVKGQVPNPWGGSAVRVLQSSAGTVALQSSAGTRTAASVFPLLPIVPLNFVRPSAVRGVWVYQTSNMRGLFHRTRHG